MATSPRCGHTRRVRVATGVADPVLVRLQHGRNRTVLLADDVTYEKADLIRLHRVRWCQRRAGLLRIFSVVREPANAVFEEVRLRNVGGRYFITVPSEVVILEPGPVRRVPMVNLSAVQYETLRTARPRRLHLAAESLMGRRRRRVRAGVARAAVRAVRAVLQFNLIPVGHVE